jgi:hypothetical protein
MAWLARNRPDLIARYCEIYRGGSYGAAGYQRELAGRVHTVARRFGLERSPPALRRRPAAQGADATPTQRAQPVHRQLSLL